MDSVQSKLRSSRLEIVLWYLFLDLRSVLYTAYLYSMVPSYPTQPDSSNILPGSSLLSILSPLHSSVSTSTSTELLPLPVLLAPYLPYHNSHNSTCRKAECETTEWALLARCVDLIAARPPRKEREMCIRSCGGEDHLKIFANVDWRVHPIACS